MFNLIDSNIKSIITNNRLIIAFSGGIDSVALAHLCSKLSKQLILCYLDHQIRPAAEIDRDIRILKETAGSLGLEYCIGHKNVPEFCKKNNLSMEDGARRLRYDFLANIARDNDCKHIATGHHLDDNSETILLKFFRGSGLKGISGIQSVTDYQELKVIRPLLKFKKQQLKQLIKKNKLSYHEDSTNNDEKIKRNLLRRKIIPQIRKINPNFEDTLVNAAGIYQAEDNYLDQESQKVYDKIVLNKNGRAITLDIKGLKLYDISLQRRVVRLAIEQLQGNLLDISLVFIENFLGNSCNQLYLNEDNKLEVKKS